MHYGPENSIAHKLTCGAKMERNENKRGVLERRYRVGLNPTSNLKISEAHVADE